MHAYFRDTANDLLKQRPSELANNEGVTNLQHVLRLAMKDNDALRAGVAVDDGEGCLTLADLDLIMDEIEDADLRRLLNAKIARFMAKRTNAEQIDGEVIA